MPFRRDLETILATHSLDPERCDLFVEGEEDRRVLLYLGGEAVCATAVITAVEHIEMGVAEGGNRERLVQIARQLDGNNACILCFIDAGLDPEDTKAPGIEVTDLPDLEGYVLQVECIEKFLRLGIGTDAWVPEDLLQMVISRARRLGILRLASQRHGWKLPFRETRLHRHIVIERGKSVDIEESSYVTALLQNAGVSVARHDEFLEVCSNVEIEMKSRCDLSLVHGKDAFCLFSEIALAEGRRREEASGILWASLERRLIGGFENLGRVLRFLETCCSEPLTV